jgi:uncharacterized phage protein (TIGR01671 family)
MREIKFRVWDNNERKWYVPQFEVYRGTLHELLISLRGDLIAREIQGAEHQSLWPGRYTLMQYIGLKDIKGREIYEGDIVLVGMDVKLCRWKQGNFTFFKRNGGIGRISKRC